jgi:hypothetical protein
MKEILTGISDLRAKIVILAIYVSNEMGGIERGMDNENTAIVNLCNQDIERYLNTNPSENKSVPIGSLNHGVCRHRAILFKRLADECGIPCRLVRGRTRGGHVWNIVKIDGKMYLVDVMQVPGQLYTEESPRAEKYRRQNGNDAIVGGIGARSIPMR